jgi:hypothetical protein
MPHEDFFEATLIEFTNWQKGEEKLVARFLRFEDLPPDLIEHLENSFESKITLKGKSWKILEINKDLRAHGQGIHVKVRLDAIS